MKRVNNFFSKLIGGVALGAALIISLSTASFADGKLTVVVDSAYIRANASTSGTVVGGANKNDTYDIISSEKDGSGYEWYKVQVSDTVTGYIRSDLVTTSGVTETAPAETTPATTATDATVAIDAEPVGGSVSSDVRVRAGASTNHDVVTTAKAKTAVTVDGYVTGSDEKVWYRVSYKEGDKDINGYIRSDFIKLDGELVDKVVAPVVEEPEPQPVVVEPEPEPVYTDYAAVYSDTDDTWYLNDYIEGTKNSIPELLEAKTNLTKQEAEFAKQLKHKNIVIGLLIFVIIAIIGLSVYGFFYFRNWYMGPEDNTEEAVYTKRSETSTEKPVRSTTTSNVRMQTVGESDYGKKKEESTASTISKSDYLAGEKLPDGTIRMPDGSIRKVRRAVKLPDGSLKFEDGSIQRPDGTTVKPGDEDVKTYTGSSSQEVRKVSYSHTSETNNDDDMEYGFLNMNKDIDDRE